MRSIHYVRNSNLKDVVLDQLLPQHDDAELNTELHEAAPGSTLQSRKTKEGAVRPSELRGARVWIQLWCDGDQDGAGGGKRLQRQAILASSMR